MGAVQEEITTSSHGAEGRDSGQGQGRGWAKITKKAGDGRKGAQNGKEKKGKNVNLVNEKDPSYSIGGRKGRMHGFTKGGKKRKEGVGGMVAAKPVPGFVTLSTERHDGKSGQEDRRA